MYNAFRCGSSLSYSAKRKDPANAGNCWRRGIFIFLRIQLLNTHEHTLFPFAT